MATTAAEYLASMAQAIRPWEDNDQVLAKLRKLDEELWSFMEDEFIPQSEETQS